MTLLRSIATVVLWAATAAALPETEAQTSEAAVAAETSELSVCPKYAGSSCWILGCSAAKGPTVCASHKCMCKPGYCYKNGRCLSAVPQVPQYTHYRTPRRPRYGVDGQRCLKGYTVTVQKHRYHCRGYCCFFRTATGRRTLHSYCRVPGHTLLHKFKMEACKPRATLLAELGEEQELTEVMQVEERENTTALSEEQDELYEEPDEEEREGDELAAEAEPAETQQSAMALAGVAMLTAMLALGGVGALLLKRQRGEFQEKLLG